MFAVASRREAWIEIADVLVHQASSKSPPAGEPKIKIALLLPPLTKRIQHLQKGTETTFLCLSDALKSF